MTKKKAQRCVLKYDKNDVVALALNACLVVFEIIGMIMRTKRHGRFGFEYYTQDSNLLMLIVAVASVFFIFRKIITQKPYPKAFSILKYTATLALLITFAVVVFVLAPGIGWPFGFRILLFGGAMYYTHLICPLLAMLSFCVFEKHSLDDKRDPLYALIYTLLYAAVLIPLNILHVVSGPYPFLMVYNQPVWATLLWIVGLAGFAYLLALVLRFFRKRK